MSSANLLIPGGPAVNDVSRRAFFDASHKTAAFIAMGCHGFGTAGSARLLRNPALARQLATEVDQRDFVAIAEIRIHGSDYDTRIVESILFPRR